MEDIIPLVAILSLISFAAYFTYLYYSTRHKERMALIESGQNAGIFKTTPGIYSSLKWGILLVAIGAGLGLGIFFDFTLDSDGPFVTLPAIFLFGGLGLLLYYRIMRNENVEV